MAEFASGVPPPEEHTKEVVKVWNDSRMPHHKVGDIIWHEGKKVKLLMKTVAAASRGVETAKGDTYDHEDWQTFDVAPATADDILGNWRREFYGRPGSWKTSDGGKRAYVEEGTTAQLGLYVDESGKLVRDGECELHVNRDFEWMAPVMVPNVKAAQDFVRSRKNAYGIVGWFDESGAVVYSDYVR